MRLGDLYDLKVHISELMLVYSGTELNNAILSAIDNAPPVETDIEVVAKDAYKQGYTDGWKERFGEPNERPQGEWIVQPHSMIMRCSLCGNEETAKDVGTINPDKHFCSFCGAYMRGTAE